MKKNVSKKIQSAIVALLKESPGVPVPKKHISQALSIHKKDYYMFDSSIQALVTDGRIIHLRDKQYAYPQQAQELIGELRTTRGGFGFVSVEGQDVDIFVAQQNLNTAFDRDRVEVRLYAASRGKRLEGYVTRIIERFRKKIVGTYHKTEYYSFVTPDERKINRDILIPEEKSMNAQDGQKVLATFDRWESDQHNPEGTITEILGNPDDPGVDVISVAYSYNLAINFTKDIEQSVKQISPDIRPEEYTGRLDLRDLTCFTIDPVDARDFDDAVSIEKSPEGNWILGVHIADVSHYVEENSSIDKEASERATSVYLVDRVIPMLPERLSNDLCSLKPQVDRLAYSCFMEMDSKLDVVKYNITPSIIHSKRRFTYEEIQAIIDNETEDTLADDVRKMQELSKALTRKRFEKGGIDFETPEVRFVLDEKGQPVEIIPKKRLDSHRLVEEFMLMANQVVARHIRNISPRKSDLLPFLYRIHEKPDEAKMAKFFDFLHALGVSVKPVKKITSKFFQQVIESIKGTKEEIIIEQVALRSMMKAIYSDKNIGHFGLGFDDYTHFTSPIRRYPDLTVHRLLKHYEKSSVPPEKGIRNKLRKIAAQSSKMERLAMEAERESIKLKQAEYINRYVGETYKAFVSGVMSFGIFVELEDTLIEGLVQISNMVDDFYIYDEKTYSMTGRDTGRRINLGDEVTVRVLSVDLEKKEIEFTFLENENNKNQKPNPKPIKKINEERRPRNRNRRKRS